ncbi:hypothetical protein COHA_001457 [Chlorella ohadii]|uniref:Fe2OG dioxygenase domain-containing protein n=1 Tax=Chlorella ohadii TaxID=2649997 RepID=A0AAD5H9G8_9CHLO|nr:hypothetical protein COHA_001457 [Chlorella ohadii]
MQAAMRAFFDLPMQTKQQVRRSADNAMGYAADELTKQTRDLKEVFDFCRTPHPELPDKHASNRTMDGFNRWPEGQAAMKAYFAEMERCSARLLEAFCVGFGLPARALHPYFEGSHTSFLRLNFYPAAEGQADQIAALQAAGKEPLGVNHHTDAGVLTLLWQDPNEPGLQVLAGDGSWRLVAPVAGALTVNVGDMFQVLTNGRAQAPVHRVLASRPGRRRYSAPFFYNPSPAADIAPQPQFVDSQRPALYRPINWAEFRGRRFAGDYADQGEEVQIAHYRTDAPAAQQAAAAVGAA